MTRFRPAVLAALAGLLVLQAAPARAQDPDLIGDLLKSRPAPALQDDNEEEEADGGDLDLPEASAPAAVRQGPVSVPGQKVGVDDHGRTQFAQTVPERYKAVATCTDSARYDIPPAQLRAACANGDRAHRLRHLVAALRREPGLLRPLPDRPRRHQGRGLRRVHGRRQPGAPLRPSAGVKAAGSGSASIHRRHPQPVADRHSRGPGLPTVGHRGCGIAASTHPCRARKLP